MMRVSLFLLSLVGLAISLYFTLVYHKLIPSNSKLIPRFCRMGETTCGFLLATSDARLFGIPNFYAGLLFYASLLMFLILSGDVQEYKTLLLVASGATVAMGIFLMHSLLVRIRVHCVLCFVSHAINAFIFILLLVGA